jgi:WhiB family redox-sensing transcriptional regulator
MTHQARTLLPLLTTWQDEALCAQTDPALWFPENRGDPGATAKQVCHGCPVRRECLADAMAREGDGDRYRRFGIWGGLTAAERAALRTRQRMAAKQAQT